jgi:hypothetical protein
MSPIKVVVFVCCALIPCVATAGSISGVVQELNGTPLVGVNITVTDLATGQVVGTAQSQAGGVFTVAIPNGAAVSVTFVNGINVPAALVGISGNVVLNDFPIFMPVKERECYTYSPCRVRRARCWCRR